MTQRAVGGSGPEIERAWRDEVRRRIREIDEGHSKLVTWEEARKRIFARE